MSRIPAIKITEGGGQDLRRSPVVYKTEVEVMQSTSPDWRLSCPTIKEKLYQSLLTGQFADIRFTVGQVEKKEILAHRYVLFLNSSVFEALFEGSLSNGSVSVTVPDVEPEAFLSFLKFLYTDEFDVQTKDATSILFLAKRYDIPRLAVLTAEHIKNNINTKNVVSVLLSAEALGEQNIAFQARYFLRTNIRYVIHEDDFRYLSEEELCQMFASDELDVSEFELFNAAIHWASEECKRQKLDTSPQNYRLVLKSVLPLIRFPLMAHKEFTLHVATKGILNDAECLNVMMHWDLSPREEATLPPLLFSNKPRMNKRPGSSMETFASNSYVPVTQESLLTREREGDGGVYYIDKRYRATSSAIPLSVVSKPPPPPRRGHSSSHSKMRHAGHSSTPQPYQQQPFSYLPDPYTGAVSYPAQYAAY